jgi:hypothetical protein
MENRSDQQVLMDRVMRLEQRNRLLSWVLLGLAALTFATMTRVGLAAGKAPEVLEASKFLLKDDDGSKRGELGVGPGGEGRILLFGRDGQLIAELPMRSQAFPLRH